MTDQTQRAINDAYQLGLARHAQQTAVNQAVARSWNPYSGMTEPTRERDVIELVSHGELSALKERDEARAEIVALKAELAALSVRVAERDASVINAIRTGKAIRHE